jgi:outer membrane murein-binding lipoprotein Lpp
VDITPFIAPVVTVIIAVVTFYGMVSSRLARIETKMDDLSEDVRRHNGVVERTSVLERDQKALWREIEKNRTDIRDVREQHLHDMDNLAKGEHN